MRGTFFFSIVCIFLFTSCSKDKQVGSNQLLAFDSVWNTQVKSLTEAKAELTKEVLMNGVTQSTTSVIGDSLAWANELEIFQPIASINKPGNRSYSQETILDDESSNLTIRRLFTDEALIVKEVRIYYLESPNNIRKIEALTSERNSLYTSARNLSLNFSEVNNKTLLTSYSIVGGQHMILGDSVQFDIHSTIRIK
jgi:hypothetical protein